MAPTLRGVSDTALLTADMRAGESKRSDRLFDDPYAKVLAGDAASRIAPIRRRLVSDGGVVARTVVLDEVVMMLIEREGIEMVLNLGAGLDARPYRLPLPSELRWIEADLPGMIEFKSAALREESPRCQLDRHGVDLSDEAARIAFLGQIPSDRPTLVISEGVVPYLEPSAVETLAEDLAGQPHVGWWWLDLMSAKTIR